jgi:hypothetical protein
VIPEKDRVCACIHRDECVRVMSVSDLLCNSKKSTLGRVARFAASVEHVRW